MRELLDKWKVRRCGEWFADTYFVSIYCSNCKVDAEMVVRKGIPKSDIELPECPHCGCSTMRLS